MTNLAQLASQLSPQARELLMRELIRAGTALPADSGTAVDPIAVVGSGCRFPGNVTGPESFWELLTSGQDAISEVPADRWDVDAYYDPDPSAPGRMTTRWGGFTSPAGECEAGSSWGAPRGEAGISTRRRGWLAVGRGELARAGIFPDS